MSRSCLKLLNLNGTGADTVSHFSGSLLRASTLSYRRLCLFFLVEISGFFRADINIFNSLLAKQPLKSQAVAFPSCFVELEHILLFGDQVFRHRNLNPSCSNCQGDLSWLWFGWSIDQALQPASVHSSATALFLSRKISYALVVPTSMEFWQWKGKDDQYVDLRAVGSNRFAGSRGVRHGRLWGHLETCFCATQTPWICLKLDEKYTKPFTCQAAFEMAGVLPAQHCCTCLLSASDWWTVHLFVWQLAQLGAQIAAAAFLAYNMPVYLHRSWRWNGWQTLDLHSVIACCIHIFFIEILVSLDRFCCRPQRHEDGRGVSWVSQIIGRWDLSRPMAAVALSPPIAITSVSGVWFSTYSSTTQHFLMIVGCDFRDPACFKSILFGAVTFVFELWVCSWAPDLKQLVRLKTRSRDLLRSLD